MKLGSMYIVHTTEDILINCRSCIFFFKIDEVMKKYRRFRYYSLFKKNYPHVHCLNIGYISMYLQDLFTFGAKVSEK